MECSQKVKMEEGLLLSSTTTTSSEEEGVTEVETKKCCSDCKTTKTPLWRSGPSGPKSLCNACGIRYRKKRPIATAATPKNDLKKGKIRGKRRNHHHRHQRDRRMRVKLMTGVGNNYIGQKKRSGGRQWGEVERAALLLMALSCGAVFA